MAFKLKSGNTPPFKQMGSSPLKVAWLVPVIMGVMSAVSKMGSKQKSGAELYEDRPAKRILDPVKQSASIKK